MDRFFNNKLAFHEFFIKIHFSIFLFLFFYSCSSGCCPFTSCDPNHQNTSEKPAPQVIIFEQNNWNMWILMLVAFILLLATIIIVVIIIKTKRFGKPKPLV